MLLMHSEKTMILQKRVTEDDLLLRFTLPVIIPALVNWSDEDAENSIALLEEAILLSHESLAMIPQSLSIQENLKLAQTNFLERSEKIDSPRARFRFHRNWHVRLRLARIARRH